MRCQVFMLIGWWHLLPTPLTFLLVLLLFVSHLLEATMAASIQPPGKQPRLQKASFSSRLQDSSFVALHPTAMSA